MTHGFAVIDGRLLTSQELREKRKKELRHEISLYQKNLNAAKRWMVLNAWWATDNKVAQVRNHINHLTGTIAEKKEELNRLCTH